MTAETAQLLRDGADLIERDGWPVQSTTEGFWNRVDTSAPSPAHAPELGPCWLWTGTIRRKGYGAVTYHGRQWIAHRLAWALTHGDPGSMCVLHHCDNPPGVRPDHLFIGTKADNNADMNAKRRRKRGAAVRNSKLADRSVVAIIGRLADGAIAEAIAKEFGVDRTTIQNVARGKAWSHLPRPAALAVGRAKAREGSLRTLQQPFVCPCGRRITGSGPFANHQRRCATMRGLAAKLETEPAEHGA